MCCCEQVSAELCGFAGADAAVCRAQGVRRRAAAIRALASEPVRHGAAPAWQRDDGERQVDGVVVRHEEVFVRDERREKPGEREESRPLEADALQLQRAVRDEACAVALHAREGAPAEARVRAPRARRAPPRILRTSLISRPRLPGRTRGATAPGSGALCQQLTYGRAGPSQFRSLY